jgi:hypothetical protein
MRTPPDPPRVAVGLYRAARVALDGLLQWLREEHPALASKLDTLAAGAGDRLLAEIPAIVETALDGRTALLTTCRAVAEAALNVPPGSVAALAKRARQARQRTTAP